MRNPRRLLTSSVAAALLSSLAAAVPAHAAGFSTGIPQGGLTLPQGAHSTGTVPRSTKVRATVALAPRDPAALAAYASAVSTKGSDSYHHYLSVREFAQRFAPAPAEVTAIRDRLRSRGLTVGTPGANGLSLPVTATAAVASAAFRTQIESYATAAGATGYATRAPQQLAAGLGAGVQGVVGLTTVAPKTSIVERKATSAGASDVHADAATATPATTSGNTATGPQACQSAAASASVNNVYTSNQIASRYGLSSFYAAGDEGHGVTVALYELEPFSASDIAAYQSCYGTSTNVEVEPVDGGAGTGAGSGEAAMDIEDLIGLAPQATIRVYEGPSNGAGAYDTYSAIVADDAAQVISSSWGLCEALEGSAGELAENTLLQEAAVQGQTFIAASGDLGADDCGNDQRAVDDPGSQPYATSVGGTTARAGTGDSAWNNAFGSTGGGASQFWGEPSYQAGHAQAQSAVSCGGTTSCREVPDISADSDPNTGYLSWWNGAWHVVGGTSVAAPTIAALVALTDASPVCGGRSVGFLNPSLYALASSAHAGDIFDVTAGTNTYDSVLGYAAAAGYDMASGLGTPASGLGPALCGDSATVSTPAAQSWATGSAVSLQLSGSSAAGAAMSYSVSGLPAGVTATATGQISGTPTTAGSYTATVTAVDAGGASAQTSFTMAVAKGSGGDSGASATIASAHGVSVRRPGSVAGRLGTHVHFRIRATAVGGGALRYSAAGLPRGLKIDASTGIITGTPRAATTRVVTVRAADGIGGASVAFRWTVAGKPRATVRSAVVSADGDAQLTVALHSGRYAAAIRRAVIESPAATVRFASTRRTVKGAAIHAHGRTVRVTTVATRSAHATPHPMTVALPALSVHLPASDRAAFRAHKLVLTVVVTDVSGVVTHLRVKA
jgi:subtilase family serine protease